MTGIEKLKALRTVTLINDDDPNAQKLIDECEDIGAFYFMVYTARGLKIGKHCIVFYDK